MSAASQERPNALQTVSAEIARLTAAAATEPELLQNVLRRMVEACQGLGGAIWLVAQRAGKEMSLRLGAGIDLEAGAGAADSLQRQQVLRAASEVILSSQPLVLMPLPPGQEPAAPGVLSNLGPYAIVGSPLRSGDDHLGTVQVWFQRQSDPKELAKLALVIQALAGELGPRLRSRQMRELGAQSQRQQRLLQLASDLTGILEPDKAAKLASSHARELLGVNRVSLFIQKGDRWRLIGISGQDSIEHHSTMVKQMTRFVSGHAANVATVVVRPEAGTNEPADPYFDGAQIHATALVPLRQGPEGRTIGTMLCESTELTVFGPPGPVGDVRPPVLALAQWLGELTGKALSAAMLHQSVPLGPSLAQLGRWGDAATATKKRRWLFWLGLLGAAIILGCIWPLTIKVEGDCVVLPQRRALVTAEAPGRIDEVLVREGDRVARDQVIARLDTRRLRSELEVTQQTRKRLEAEAERQRGQGKEALARMASLEASAASQTEKRLELEIEMATLRAPMDGIVLTKEVHLKTGTFLQAGEVMTELASMDAWDLRVLVQEADISLVEEALDKKAPRPVNYLLYTQSARPMSASLETKQQISPALQASKDGGVFSITLPRIHFPKDLEPIMRPGLTGRAKIELDRRPAGYVLLRKFARWLRMRWWL